MEKSFPRIEVRRTSHNHPWTYGDLDGRQREIAAEIRAKGTPGALLFSEVSPVITYGRRTSPEDLHLTPEQAATSGVSLQSVDRGGMATYHGPGQWVVFPVDTLTQLVGDSRGVRKTVNALLESASAAAQAILGPAFEHEVQIREGCETGVWWKHRKICSVGVHIQDGVLLHGLALNVFSTHQSFVGLRPCGLDAEVGYLHPHEDQDVFLNVRHHLEAELLKRLWRTHP